MNRLLTLLLLCLLHLSVAFASKFQLSLTVSPSCATSIYTDEGAYEAGSSVYLNAYANNGFVFQGWYEGETLVSAESYCTYTMPARNVHLTAQYIYDPDVPANPGESMEYILTVEARPKNVGSFNLPSTSYQTAGDNVNIYAYPDFGYQLLHWEDKQGNIISDAEALQFEMPSSNTHIYGVFEYNPAPPRNPGSNHWNPELGELIMDDFTPGGLFDEAYNALYGVDNDKVNSIIVIGRINDRDWGVNYYNNCKTIDFSRTTGSTTVPMYAFSNSALKSIYLPATIEVIDRYAFYNCHQLSSLAIYSVVPPELGNGAFAGVSDEFIIYVPATALPAYQESEGWKDYTIMPLLEALHSLTVSLPQNVKVADYDQMWLELTNTKNGQRIHYVVTDRTSYTFSNIISNTSWSAVLRNQRGDVFGRIDNIDVQDEDVSVTFDALAKPQHVNLSVITSEGSDVTQQCQITWLDAADEYVAQAPRLTGMLAGTKLGYRITLPQALSMLYTAPAQATYIVAESDNNVQCRLGTLKQIMLTGKVKDALTGKAIYGANVSASQTFGGKYSKTLSTKTDAEGCYTMTVSDVPTTIAVSATDYISQTLDCTEQMSGTTSVTMSDIAILPITGAVISLSMTYTKCPTSADDTDTFQEWYGDYGNVTYSIYNRTKHRAISQYNVQYPSIVLLEDVSEGDVLELTATSQTAAFMPVSTTATIDERQSATATFNFVELGKVKATFATNANAAVVGSLYDANGKLVQTGEYKNATLTFDTLPDGNYQLVSMGSSQFFNTIYDLKQLPQTGLVKGTDYVLHTAEVKRGEVSFISIDEVPVLNESKLYYTDDATTFTANKASVVVGNLLTLTAHLDFKRAYESKVSQVNLIVDLPEGCNFVENSVMVGNAICTYTHSDHRLTIPVATPSDRVRFCVLPTTSGDCAPSAFAQFEFDGKSILQPIGSAAFNAKGTDIRVPELTTTETIKVSGFSKPNAEVSIYANDILVGHALASAAGTWNTEITLPDTYDYSIHDIVARFTNNAGLMLQSETKYVQYIPEAITLKRVSMTHYNRYYHREMPIIWDYMGGVRSASSYYFYTAANFTLVADFSQNDTTRISDVKFNVFLSNGKCMQIPAKFSENSGKFVAVRQFEGYALPINVSVNYNLNDIAPADNTKQIAEDFKNYEKATAAILGADDSYDLEIVEDEDDHTTYRLQYSALDEPYVWTVRELDYMTARNMLREQSFQHTPSETGEGYTCTLVEETKHGMVLYLMDTEAEVAFELSLEDPNYSGSPRRALKFKVDWAALAKKGRGDIKKTIRGLKKHFSDPQNWIDDGLNVWGFVLDALDIKKYIDSRDFNQCFDVMDRYVDQMLARKEAVFKKMLAKCKDGSYKLSPEQRQSYQKQLNNIDNSIGMFINTFGSYVELYKAALKASLWTDLLTMGAGKAIGAVGKAGKIMKKSKNVKYFQYLIGKPRTRDRVESGLGIAFSYAINGLNDIIDPEFNNFEKVERDMYQWMKESATTTMKTLNIIERNIKSSSKRCEENEEDDPEDPTDPPFDDIDPIHDPSGFVYEAVFSNRLAGVTATCYYKEEVEDMYGDIQENIVKWDAEEYAQQNPLFTDENGYYSWDVPQGMWQVRFEKEGYETACSEWLPVPPPQLDVNIGMKQNVQPNVIKAHAYPDAVEVEFDKYMMPETLTADNITVMAGGKPVTGNVIMLNEEVSYEGAEERFASKVRFKAAAPFDTEEVTLMVHNRVKSYAGIRMQDDFSQTFTVEPELRRIEVTDEISLNSGESVTLFVTAAPQAAAGGKTLRLTSSSDIIATTTSTAVTLDNLGKAEVTINGELPGTAAITFSVDGYDLQTMTIVNVRMAETVSDFPAPTASMPSGSVVEKGTAIVLSCAAPGATIYYTTDGSCPCEEQTRLTYTTPIVVNHTMKIRAMAVAEDMTESDVVEFSYYVEGEDGISDISLDDVFRVYPLPVRDKLNVTMGGKTIESATLVSTNGRLVARSTHSDTTVTLDVNDLPAGIYLITVATEDKRFSRKVVKLE